MKIAAVEWMPGELELLTKIDFDNVIEHYVKLANSNDANLIIFPGFTGIFYQQILSSTKTINQILNKCDSDGYLDYMKTLSAKYGLAICPGSYWRKENAGFYNISSIIDNGELCLEQKQLYLAKWEREKGFMRGSFQNIINLSDWKVGLLLTTDIFYPQVARSLALMGADIILAPIGFVGQKNPWLQLAGVWKDVQQNQIFAVESAFNGQLGEQYFWGETIVHGPVEMTEKQNGLLTRSFHKKGLIFATLDNDARKKAISNCNFLNQLNSEFYRKMGMFGGCR